VHGHASTAAGQAAIVTGRRAGVKPLLACDRAENRLERRVGTCL
jgi:hypothetical protein